MPDLECPPQADLLPLATGEPCDPDVAAHVSSCPNCGSLIEFLRNEVELLSNLIMSPIAARPTFVVHQPPTPQSASAPQDEQTPTVIGRYQVLGRLGSGGQADVFRAVHPNLFLDVVVKLGRRNTATDPAAHERLLEEGRLLSELEHPHIARVYDLDFHEGRPFLALQYVRGVNLRQHAQDVRLPAPEMARLMAKIAQALAAAHTRGILHLDLKPENIVIDQSGEPVVIDFGLAQLRDAWSPDESQRYGGTPSFMSPEQARVILGISPAIGTSAAIGPSADIFSLGGVLYYLLTGRAPFAADKIVQSLESAAHYRFDSAALDQPDVAEPLAAICRKALAENPADRFASAEELARQLERFADGPEHRTTRRRWVAVGLAAGLLAALGFYAARSRPPQKPKQALPPVQTEIRTRAAGPQGAFHDLIDLLPMTDDDRLVIHMRLPADYRAVVLLVDADGEFQQIPVAEFSVTQSGGAVDIDYPRPGQTAQWKSPPGTCLLLICARRGGEIDGRSLKPLLAGAWPNLPEQDMGIEFDRNKIELPGSYRQTLAALPSAA